MLYQKIALIFSKETTLTITLRDHQSHSYTEFTAYYSLIYKPKETNEGEEYLPDSLMKVNLENLNYPKIIKLVNSNEKMQCPKVRRDKYGFPEKYIHHLLFLFFFFNFDQKKIFPEEIFAHTREN